MSRYHKDFEFFLLIIDYDERLSDKIDARFQIVTLDDVIPDKKIQSQMLFRYTAFEMSNALKPYLMLYLLDKLKKNKVIYFDADIYVLNNLSAIDEYFSKGDILITPHANTPQPNDGKIPGDGFILKGGSYNAGFIGVSNTVNGLAFLNWWKGHLQEKCFSHRYGTFVDQSWLNLAVIYFNRIYVITHPGFNIAYWNLHERNLAFDSVQKKYTCNSQDLLFVHLSGLDFNNPDNISKFQNRYSLGQFPLFKTIVEQYIADIKESCLDSKLKYIYNSFPSGKPIDANMRVFYQDNIEMYNSCIPFTKEFEKIFLKDYKRAVLRNRIRWLLFITKSAIKKALHLF